MNVKDLKNLRITMGYSGEYIADRMSTTKQTISNVEYGKSNDMTKVFYEHILLLEIQNDNRVNDIISELETTISHLKNISTREKHTI